MTFVHSLKDRFRREMFIPSWLGVFINSNFFLSRSISNGIKSNAHYMEGTMLDFGCGRKPYVSLFNVKEHIGVDIENPEYKNDQCIDKIYDGTTIPFENNHFDSIFCSEVLTHVFEAEAIARELNRVLKPGGHFLLTVPFIWKENQQPNDSARYTSFGIKYLLQKNGFEIISQQKSGHYFLVIVQLRADYMYSSLFPNIKILKLLLTFLFIFPLNLFGMVFSLILPKNRALFFNSVIVARKK